MTVRSRAVASRAPSRCSRSVCPSSLTSSITSPRASPLAARRPRMEKSPSRTAARIFERVCRGRTTRCRRLKATPSHIKATARSTVSCVRALRPASQSSSMETTTAGNPESKARRIMRRSKLRRPPRLNAGSSVENEESGFAGWRGVLTPL